MSTVGTRFIPNEAIQIRRAGTDDAAGSRLRLVGEEAVSSLLEVNEDDARPRLIVMARPGAHVVELEFLVVLEEGNL